MPLTKYSTSPHDSYHYITTRTVASHSIPEIRIVVDNPFSSVGFLVRPSEVHRENSNGKDYGTIATRGSISTEDRMKDEMEDSLHDRCHHPRHVVRSILTPEYKTACDSSNAAHASQRRRAKRPLPLPANVVCLPKSQLKHIPFYI